MTAPLYALGWALVTLTRGLLIAAVIVFGIGACAGTDMPSPNTARIALDKAADGMDRTGAAIAAACVYEPEPAWCREAKDGYEQTRQAFGLVADFVSTYEMVTQ